MKNVIRSMALLGLCSTSIAWADVVHIADGDCAGLKTAAGSAAGHEPSTIVLERNGLYQNCQLNVIGHIVIDGAGASMPITLVRQDSGAAGQFVVAKGGSLTMRQINLSDDKKHTPTTGLTPSFVVVDQPVFSIAGSLFLDSASIVDNVVSYSATGALGGGLFAGEGDMTLRNVTIDSNDVENDAAPLFRGGKVTITGSTINGNTGLVFGSGSISIGNSIVAGNNHACSAKLISLGGNVTDDARCGLSGLKDRVVADALLLDRGLHGSVIDTVALRDNSPAVGNGIASLCEATDARGYSRNEKACDSGAYEMGGGVGKLSETGMSGVFYDALHDGHYVSIQRLPNETALVIWNTFDEKGVPAWLFGVGDVAGKAIHAQFSRNVGGKLLPGGDVVGAHPVPWGSVDVNLSDCSNAKLSYTSSDSTFGSGSVALVRVASIDGVDCSL